MNKILGNLLTLGVSVVILLIFGKIIFGLVAATDTSWLTGLLPANTSPKEIAIIAAFAVVAMIGAVKSGGNGTVVFTWIAAGLLIFGFLGTVFVEDAPEVYIKMRKDNREHLLSEKDADDTANQAEQTAKVSANGYVQAKYKYPSRTIVISDDNRLFWRSTNIKTLVENGHIVKYDLDSDKFITEVKIDGQWFEYDQLKCWEKNEAEAARWYARYPGPPIDVYYEIYQPVETRNEC